MTAQALDLRRAFGAIRRRRVLLIALVVAGLATGLLLTLLQPRVFVARSAVLLPPSRLNQEGEPLRDMVTETHIATSGEILARVGRAFRPPVPAGALRDRLRVRPLSADILEISAEGASPRDAVSLVDAVAKEYIAYANSVTAAEADTSVAVLEEQANELDRRIRVLDDSIARHSAELAGQRSGSPEALRLAALLDSLRTAQVDAARQLSSLNTRIAESRLNVELGRRGTRVLGPTERPERQERPRPSRNIGVGGLVGLMGGAMLAIALDQRDRRLLTRGEIADAVGSPVLASLSVPPHDSIEACAAVLEAWTPSVVDSLALRQAFSDLGVGEQRSPANVIVVALPGDAPGLLIAFQLAAFAATMEIRTAFIVGTQDPGAAQLRSACRRSGAARPNLRVHGAVEEVAAQDLSWSELTVVATVGPGEGDQFPAPTWGRRTVTVISVSSGFATAETLASSALACLDAGHPVRGVFVADPDPGDRTTGRLGLLLPGPDGASTQQAQVAETHIPVR